MKKIENLFLDIYRIINPKMRPMIDYIRKQNKKELIGCEIGVANGDNAKQILTTLLMKKLYLVEPWLEYKEDDNVEKRYIGGEQKCRKKLKRWDDKIVSIKKYSENAVNSIPDNLDFVYIDGNHDYDFVKKDIELYYPKIKDGGVIGGHDFIGSTQGVVRAVIGFADSHNLELQSSGVDWWIVKNVN